MVMRARFVAAVGVIWLIILGAAVGGWAHQAKQDASAVAAASAASGAYPESAKGLKRLVEDMFVAVKSKDDAKISSYMSGLVIPGHGAWFVQTFGASEGARLEAKYS